MKTAIIVQARMTSTRLPGKVLKRVLDKPLLEYQIDRLKRVRLADQVVIATTTNVTDDLIVRLCEDLNISCYRGSELDVLERYYCAAQNNQVDLVVRVTSDCPLIDPAVIDLVIQHYQDSSGGYDYVSNCLPQRTYPRGMDTEIFSSVALGEAFQEATSQPDREHVTPFIYRQPERYSLGFVNHIEDRSQYRWTVDTPEDFGLIELMLRSLYPNHPNFGLTDCLELLAQNPEWSKLNNHIEQKEYGK